LQLKKSAKNFRIKEEYCYSSGGTPHIFFEKLLGSVDTKIIHHNSWHFASGRHLTGGGFLATLPL
jgi:hypothetical protein